MYAVEYDVYDLVLMLKNKGIINDNRKYTTMDLERLQFLIINEQRFNEYCEIFNIYMGKNLTYILGKFKESIRIDCREYMYKIQNSLYLNNLIHTKKYNELQVKLGHIFLDPISDEVFKILLNKLENNKKDIDQIIKYHSAYPNRSLMSALI